MINRHPIYGAEKPIRPVIHETEPSPDERQAAFNEVDTLAVSAVAAVAEATATIKSDHDIEIKLHDGLTRDEKVLAIIGSAALGLSLASAIIGGSEVVTNGSFIIGVSAISVAGIKRVNRQLGGRRFYG